ncbi:rCG41597 [Rattus norvegicus]|uniref:RCG41597 n=1 Tax=Rattus norvegicus TaxID=10116 RepID=A6IHE4_RAT|nr:rCG41597 [Rattus norvegicus]
MLVYCAKKSSSFNLSDKRKKKDETLISFLPLIKTHLVVFLHTG